MISENKHTPGPWTLNDEIGAMIVTGGPEDRYVCDVQIYQVPRVMGLPYEEERTANAKLIAAAPELLEQLIKLYMAVYAGNSVSLEDAMNRSVKDDLIEQEIIAAIKKATV